ncbi:MAG TPA: aminopeptidase P N-terminal domain-containing protein, partial [Vicinamibacterales bacterium]
PARASFSADDQPGFVQAADFQYLTGLEEPVGAVLVLDGAASSSTLFVQPRNPLLTRRAIAPDSVSARDLQVSEVRNVDALEPWLRQRLSRSSTIARISRRFGTRSSRTTTSTGR